MIFCPVTMRRWCVNKWLCRFVQETRKENGENYPPSTIRSLLSTFQRVMQGNKVTFRFFDKSDLKFRDLRNTLDSVCVSLRKEGIGAVRKHAAVISLDDERIMWESGVLGTDSPWALVHAVFFVVGLHFSLRGGRSTDSSLSANLIVCLVMVHTVRTAIMSTLSMVQRTIRENLLKLIPTRLLVRMLSQD